VEKLLLFIKQNLKFLWAVIDSINNAIYGLLFDKTMKRSLNAISNNVDISPYTFKELKASDTNDLYELIKNQKESDLNYFQPHGFDHDSIRGKLKQKAFLMMGIYFEQQLIGYFFLRFFVNKKCFVGRLIDADYRGKGVGLLMNKIMYGIAWNMKFRCLSTISKSNHFIMKAHKKNTTMVVLKELNNNFLLVEFINPDLSNN